MKQFFILAITVTLSTCAATGPLYHEHQANVRTLDNMTSRIYFYRNSRFVSKALDAEIYLNGKKVGECANNAYFFVATKAGETTFNVENTAAPGSHSIKKKLEGGQEYYYEIIVNESYVNAGMILGLVGQGAYVANNDSVSGWFFKEVPQAQATQLLRNKVFSLNGE